jgi:glycosyltransferase involved in cell wall biosynthesis
VTAGRPLVSVVMAAYNAGRHIRAALASLARQTVNDLEVIVVDDGSTDSTCRMVQLAARRDRRVRLVQLRRNRGQAAALNVGAEQARGRYLAILDADDEATAGRLEHQLAAMARDPRLVLVGGAVEPWCDRYAKAGPAWRYASDDAAIRVRSLFKSEFISGAMTFDRERLSRHRLRFDESLRVGADWALSIQAMRIGRVANVDEVVMKYRVHPGQLTSGMMDDLSSDSARIRAGYLAWLGARPTDDELRVHLAVSPCNYWPFGAHPYFRQQRASIAEESARWFERLKAAAARGAGVPRDELLAYLEEIESRIATSVADSGEAIGPEADSCPVAYPRPCGAELPQIEPCRRSGAGPKGQRRLLTRGS